LLTSIHHGMDSALGEDGHFDGREDGLHDTRVVFFDGVGVRFAL
jgi:hypothetical protein